MAENVTKTINGVEYEISPFMGMHGWRLQLRLAKLLGPSIKEGLAALPKGKVADMMNSEIDPAMLGGAVAAFMDALAEGDPQGKLVAELLSQTQRSGVLLSEQAINREYAGNYGEMIKALMAVIEANNFFSVRSIGILSALENMAGGNPAS